MADESKLLSGVRVVEAATMIMAPSAGVVLADFGAEVIKLETPGGGDPNRNLHRLPGMPISEFDYCFQQDNRNKKFIAVDLKTDEGYSVFRKLIESADVFITNHRIQALEKLKLTYEALSKINPRLVYAVGTGFGETGAEATKPGYDMVAYWSRSGFELAVTPEDALLGQIPAGTGDHPTGMSLVAGIMMALYSRERTGKGYKISSSLLANGAWSNSDSIQAALVGAEFLEKRPRENAYSYGNQYFKTSDGGIFKITMVDAERVWRGMCNAIERPELIDDERYREFDERIQRVPELIKLFDAAFSSHDLEHWLEELTKYDVPHSKLSSYDDITDDRQMHETGVFRDLDHPQFGTVKTVNTPFEIVGETKVSSRAAGGLGADTEAVLLDLGYDVAAISLLCENAIIQTS